MKISVTSLAGVISSLRTWSKLCLALLALLVPLTAFGQTTGSLPVRVLDQSGAVVAGATVKVKNLETGQEREQMTDSEGAVTITNLPPGRYTVEVSVSGFKTVTIENVMVGVARAVELPVRRRQASAQNRSPYRWQTSRLRIP
jgi:uncharacterized protein (DUF2141 family)